MKTLETNLWSLRSQGEIIAITTNGFVKRSGEAVMGRGCAYEATQKLPNIARRLGSCITKWGNRVFYFKAQGLITFPVKHHWAEEADLKLIAKSCAQLMHILDKFGIKAVYLPRPGCGNGRLSWDEVRPILEPLLDNRVTIVTFPKKYI